MASGTPFMPLYVGDYLADTSHLTTIEHGAYLLLIMTYWRHGKPLPGDDRKLARICGLTGQQWARIKPQILDFFWAEEITENGHPIKWYHHSRVDCELERANDKYLKKRKGGLARAKQRYSTAPETLQLNQNQNQSSSKDQEYTSLSTTDNITTLHAFAGKTIRLTARDMGVWAERYRAVGDLRAELGSLDDWITGQDEAMRKKWFHVVSGSLNKKHQKALAEHRAAETGEDMDGFIC